MNVILIPLLSVIFAAGAFYAYTNTKFITYDQAAKDVGDIKVHNATQDEQVKQMRDLLIVLSSKVDALRMSAPISGPGSGGGAAVGGSTRQGP